MRSYYSHLQKFDPTLSKAAQVLRSSAIFPVFQDEKIKTRLLFLGYWLLKRRISEIRSHAILRDVKGKIVKEIFSTISEPKAYRIEVSELHEEPFLGTIEIEFLSETDLVFPFPAVTVNYYGADFSTVVHTAERTYNSQEDAKKNGETTVPESGFNIYAEDKKAPFFTFINGNELVLKQKMNIDFYNSFEEKLSGNLELSQFEPLEIRFIYPANDFPLAGFLKSKPGCCKIHFNLNGVFPRLLVGNQMESPFAKVITHTYYDCTEAKDPSNFWNPCDPAWHSASLMLPVLSCDHTTTLSFYPIFAPSPFTLDLETYNKEGELLGSFTEALTFEINFDQFQQLPLDAIYPSQEIFAVRVIARALSDTPIPARIKIAIDIGHKLKGLPCNICTNLQPYLPSFSEKKSSFKWAPLLADQPDSYAFLMNSSPKKKMNESASVKLTIYREKDTVTIEREFTIPPQGFHRICPNEDPELNDFLQGTIGWFTAVTSNPYMTTYYFADNPSGVIGGDHGY